jgi:hypothetical protein
MGGAATLSMQPAVVPRECRREAALSVWRAGREHCEPCRPGPESIPEVRVRCQECDAAWRCRRDGMRERPAPAKGAGGEGACVRVRHSADQTLHFDMRAPLKERCAAGGARGMRSSRSVRAELKRSQRGNQACRKRCAGWDEKKPAGDRCPLAPRCSLGKVTHAVGFVSWGMGPKRSLVPRRRAFARRGHPCA